MPRWLYATKWGTAALRSGGNLTIFALGTTLALGAAAEPPAPPPQNTTKPIIIVGDVPRPSVEPSIHPLCEQACITEGRCGYEGGECIAVRPEQCRRSDACLYDGLCQLRGGRCQASNWGHCLDSNHCADGRRCFYVPDSGSCDYERQSKPAMIVGIVGTGLAAAVGLFGGLVLDLDGFPFGGEGPSDVHHIVPLVSAGVMAAVFVPLIIWGAPKRDRDEAVVRARVGASGLKMEVNF